MSLDRSIDAQARVWPAPLEEIRAGRKKTHWMWFVFPQLRGLGRSPTAEHYGIADMAEARNYLTHEVLGGRLIEISTAMLLHQEKPARAILGPVDTLKLRSSMTLFQQAGRVPIFGQVVAAFFAGQSCTLTLGLLGSETA